jgi:hypothetical protein
VPGVTAALEVDGNRGSKTKATTKGAHVLFINPAYGLWEKYLSTFYRPFQS